MTTRLSPQYDEHVFARDYATFVDIYAQLSALVGEDHQLAKRMQEIQAKTATVFAMQVWTGMSEEEINIEARRIVMANEARQIINTSMAMLEQYKKQRERCKKLLVIADTSQAAYKAWKKIIAILDRKEGKSKPKAKTPRILH